jgi:hypothetical protein
MPQGGATPDENDRWLWSRSGDQRARTLGDGAPSYNGFGVCQEMARKICKWRGNKRNRTIMTGTGTNTQGVLHGCTGGKVRRPRGPR